MRILLLLLVPLMLYLGACAGKKAVVANDDTNLMYVELMPKRSVEILVRDLVTLNSKPTGLKVVKPLEASTNSWLLQFDPETVNARELLKAVKNYPNTVDAHLGE